MDPLKLATALRALLAEMLEEGEGALSDESASFLIEKAQQIGDPELTGELLDAIQEAILANEQSSAADEAPVVYEKEVPDYDYEDTELTYPQLAPHEIDVPEEPEEVEIIVQVWDAAKQDFVEKNLGKRLLVPSGCETPMRFSPFESTATFRSALPRDKEKDANLYMAYKNLGIVSRDWIRENVDEDIDGEKEDKRIADDIPLDLARQGMPDPQSGVAQTPGIDPNGQPGSNNGAPLPPGPGPGRGNKYAPGDNLAGGGE